MPAIAAALSASMPPASASAGADRLAEHQHVAGPRTPLAEHAIGVHHALHGEPEDRLRVADRVPTGDRAAGLGDDRGGGVEDGDDGLTREVLGERGHVDRDHHPAAHREHVAARVGRGDRAEVGRMVDQRREEVGGADQRHVGRHLVDRGVVERRQPDEQRRVDAGGHLADQVGEQRRTPLGRAPAARRPLGQLEVGEISSQQSSRAQPTVCPCTRSARTRSPRPDARSTVANAVDRAGICTPWAATRRSSSTSARSSPAISTRTSSECGRPGWPPGRRCAPQGSCPAAPMGTVAQLHVSKGGLPKLPTRPRARSAGAASMVTGRPHVSTTAGPGRRCACGAPR